MMNSKSWLCNCSLHSIYAQCTHTIPLCFTGETSICSDHSVHLRMMNSPSINRKPALRQDSLQGMAAPQTWCARCRPFVNNTLSNVYRKGIGQKNQTTFISQWLYIYKNSLKSRYWTFANKTWQILHIAIVGRTKNSGNQLPNKGLLFYNCLTCAFLQAFVKQWKK